MRWSSRRLVGLCALLKGRSAASTSMASTSLSPAMLPNLLHQRMEADVVRRVISRYHSPLHSLASGHSFLLLSPAGTEWLQAPVRSNSSYAPLEPQSRGGMLVVQPGYNRNSEATLQEALRLARSLTGEECPHLTIGPHAVSAATYIGRGSVERVAEHAKALEVDQIFLNAILNPVQQRNLETAWGRTVMDRVALIINIFAARAFTREARLQVELADLDFKASRLVRGRSATGARGTFADAMEVVSARERGRASSATGGLGGSAGGGESELRLQRLRIVRQRKVVQLRLAEVQQSRAQQRKRRKRSGVITVALVGYTNAGKSSLMSAITHRDAEVADQLFATLDPLMARCQLPSGRHVVLSDTVGFISNLPHQLIDAFRATLEEVVEAEVLLHVIDASSPAAPQQREAVFEVLRELGIPDQDMNDRMIEVWNKVDLLLPDQPWQYPGGQAGDDHLEEDSGRDHPAPDVLLARLEQEFELLTRGSAVQPARVLASVANGLGLEKLMDLLDQRTSNPSADTWKNQERGRVARARGPRSMLVELAAEAADAAGRR